MRFPHWRYYRGDYLSDNLPENIEDEILRIKGFLREVEES
jgi:hypothetical protein